MIWSTFPRCSKAYTPEYRATAHEVAKKLGIVDEGAQVSVTGPTYETPAEIRAYKTLGSRCSQAAHSS